MSLKTQQQRNCASKEDDAMDGRLNDNHRNQQSSDIQIDHLKGSKEWVNAQMGFDARWPLLHGVCLGVVVMGSANQRAGPRPWRINPADAPEGGIDGHVEKCAYGGMMRKKTVQMP